MTLDGRILKGLFEHERLKPTNIRTSQGNIHNLTGLKQIMNAGFKTNESQKLLITKESKFK